MALFKIRSALAEAPDFCPPVRPADRDGCTVEVRTHNPYAEAAISRVIHQERLRQPEHEESLLGVAPRARPASSPRATDALRREKRAAEHDIAHDLGIGGALGDGLEVVFIELSYLDTGSALGHREQGFRHRDAHLLSLSGVAGDAMRA